MPVRAIAAFASPRRNWQKRQDHKHLPRVATSQRAALWQEKHLSAFHPKRLGRIEMLCFVRAGFEFRQHARPDALHLRGVVRAIARALVQRARVRPSVRKHVSSPCLVVMQSHHAPPGASRKTTSTPVQINDRTAHLRSNSGSLRSEDAHARDARLQGCRLVMPLFARFARPGIFGLATPDWADRLI